MIDMFGDGLTAVLIRRADDAVCLHVMVASFVRIQKKVKLVSVSLTTTDERSELTTLGIRLCRTWARILWIGHHRIAT
jgi:hypothetical protein